MTSLSKLRIELLLYSFFCGVVAIGFTAVVFAILSVYTTWDRALCLVLACIVGVIFAALGALLTTRAAMLPIKAIRQTILHISKQDEGTKPVKLEDLHVGRTLVTDLTTEIYNLSGGFDLSKKTKKY